MSGIPKELIQAARIDGAGTFRAFWSVVLPLSRNAAVTVSLFAFLWAWSDFVFASTLDSGGDRQPITLGIYRYIGNNNQDWNSIMATAVVASVPAADPAHPGPALRGGRRHRRSSEGLTTTLLSPPPFDIHRPRERRATMSADTVSTTFSVSEIPFSPPLRLDCLRSRRCTTPSRTSISSPTRPACIRCCRWCPPPTASGSGPRSSAPRISSPGGARAGEIAATFAADTVLIRGSGLGLQLRRRAELTPFSGFASSSTRWTVRWSTPPTRQAGGTGSPCSPAPPRCTATRRWVRPTAA